ncbi:hypothetical protein RhiirA5_352034 [Rhizophagus irregularis]|uniref:Hyaluronan/mRNA-binding protein domain-containing protein n=3 Tax=Rhizophagus irregularis TaxID=588596 RepID=U9SUD5_RHIID|nr:hypothetical protein GLOIN_2v1634688 [Rhizophagus irregularis DAOM 181602=DAOM 197198]XP_025182402.1 hypothetical protein GLOIN_2v1565738 [Rhizophagus irregularis DAOM 181602=DAOM 197198]EXX51325.1 hypothetical protein RirG_262870 [Rhizophagus irregularis DAOM 197198w]PKC13129.1 hypothetical protein RhiirA5_352034 [Rhizophagus irregularis]PKC74536.1 hypothetical protein RhiirA1_408940 [Rhizophagus irregularis]PKY15891.1 hypothetical protein RhiirB3_402258 [Rhizophagus irregularis]POG68702.|eukprot:XP_025175568.1 hypothetical protein GLOIN_2v1634688 [Rhizophagus irregularis DAOM 181602=DAOM 197198]
MTRTKQSTTPHALVKDRHLQRSGTTDPRGNPKKEGGGPHNWGKPTDVLAELDEHYEFKEETPKYNKEKVQDTKAAETNRETGKIQVVKPEEFEILHRATNS